MSLRLQFFIALIFTYNLLSYEEDRIFLISAAKAIETSDLLSYTQSIKKDSLYPEERTTLSTMILLKKTSLEKSSILSALVGLFGAATTSILYKSPYFLLFFAPFFAYSLQEAWQYQSLCTMGKIMDKKSIFYVMSESKDSFQGLKTFFQDIPLAQAALRDILKKYP